jgi:predicted enzyme related to lactoylglutathione lyase
MTPIHMNGKICYVEIPATDVAKSASFYQQAFGWSIREHGDGNVSFDDATGHVSGMWRLGYPPAAVPGFVISVMVDDAVETLDRIVALGGEVVQPIGHEPPEITAHFRDPAGNVMGIYQHRG